MWKWTYRLNVFSEQWFRTETRFETEALKSPTRKQPFGFPLLHYMIGLKKLAWLFHPIRSKTKPNRYSIARVFPRFPSGFIYLVHWIVCPLYTWLASVITLVLLWCLDLRHSISLGHVISCQEYTLPFSHLQSRNGFTEVNIAFKRHVLWTLD